MPKKGKKDEPKKKPPVKPPKPPKPPGPPAPPPAPPVGPQFDRSPAAIAEYHADVTRILDLGLLPLRDVVETALGDYNPHSKNVVEWMIARANTAGY